MKDYKGELDGHLEDTSDRERIQRSISSSLRKNQSGSRLQRGAEEFFKRKSSEGERVQEEKEGVSH